MLQQICKMQVQSCKIHIFKVQGKQGKACDICKLAKVKLLPGNAFALTIQYFSESRKTEERVIASASCSVRR